MKNLPEKATQLKAASYNPRTITNQRLNKLQDSMTTFGDLSGIVFNVRTKTLISGHQRTATIDLKKAKIVQKPVQDEHGTVAVGYVEAQTKKGKIRIPYRAVDWDLTKEKAANIAANAHGGTFDKEKLRMVLADIEKSKKFDIELTGLDPLTLKSLKLPDDGKLKPKTEFKELGEDLETSHQCPKCSYRW
jgi:hypothetical protein